MNNNDLPDDDVLQLVFGELDDTRRAAVRKAVAEDAELAATARGLEAAVAAVRAENAGHLSEEFNDRLRQRIAEVFDQAQAETTRPTFLSRSLSKWSWIMRSPVSRATAAVIFVLAVGGVVLWFHGGGATPSFADFLQPFLDAKTVKYKMTVEMTRLPAGVMKGIPAEMQKGFMKTTTEVMELDASRNRHESEMPGQPTTVRIWDGTQGKSLHLGPAEKRATVYNYANLPKDETPSDCPVGHVAIFRAALLDARDIPDFKRESLGEKEIDGRQVVGFRISFPATVFSVWGDPKTGLPVRMEATMTLMPDTKLTMSDFEFNVDLDESLFSVEPPAGYEVTVVQAPTSDGSPADEKDLIEMFRCYSELSDGPFPDSLDLQAISQMVGRDFAIRMFLELTPGKGKLNEEQRHKIEELVQKSTDLQKLAGGKEKPNKERMDKIEEQMLDLLDWERLAPGQGKPNREQMEKIIEAETQKYMKAQLPKIMAATTRFQQGLRFTGLLPPEADAHYAGKGVSLGAADTPIFWYCSKDAKKYRVIYADLSVRDADTPPSVPDAQPVPAPSSPKE